MHPYQESKTLNGIVYSVVLIYLVKRLGRKNYTLLHLKLSSVLLSSGVPYNLYFLHFSRANSRK